MSTARLEALLEERLGLLCVDWQRARLAELLAHRRFPDPDAPDAAGQSLSREQLQSLIEQVLIGETYFFREPAHLSVLAELAVPERLQHKEPGRPVRILSIGCSSGEEVYSAAISLGSYHSDFAAGRITLAGIDVSTAAIHKARRARYSAWALRTTPAAVRERWFEPEGQEGPEGKEHQLCPEIRALVRFEERNLLDPDPNFWTPGGFDIVFCRNVLIYFSARSMRLALVRLAQALAPGGFLFLGHSETLRGISDDFELCHLPDAFFYRRKPLLVPAESIVYPDSSASAARAVLEGVGPSVQSSWFASISRSTERIARLASGLTPPPGGPSRTIHVHCGEPAEVWSLLLPIAQRISSEQFDQALELLGQLPTTVSQSGPALLTTATILCGQGRHSAARAICQDLLDAGQQAAEAHYLVGLCQENGEEKESAKKSHKEAIRADPRFAMAHLHLGIALRRSGQRELARGPLSQALALLGHERAERILLFGGGFAREALLSLCRAELRALGVEP